MNALTRLVRAGYNLKNEREAQDDDRNRRQEDSRRLQNTCKSISQRVNEHGLATMPHVDRTLISFGWLVFLARWLFDFGLVGVPSGFSV